MTETPLHKAAANNHVEVMRFLLEWKGEEKPELEAKNMVLQSFAYLFSIYTRFCCHTMNHVPSRSDASISKAMSSAKVVNFF